jgi:plasmid stabilization system protein ParE
MSGTYRGTEILHHAGAVMGGSSQMIKVRAAKLDISVAVNRGDLSAALLANRIIDVCVAGLDPTTEKTEHEKRVGTFRSKTSGRVVTLSVSDGLHLMSVDGRAPVAVSPDGADILRFPDTLDFIKQSVSMQGDAIVLSDFDSEDVLDKIADHGEATIGDRAGTYRSDAIDATILVEDRSSGLRAVIHGRHGLAYYQLEPINIDIWRIENSAMPMMSAILTFDTDCGGLTIDMTWARRLHFARTYGP